MKALDTALKATATAGFTAALFALPLGLALLWRVAPGADEVEAVATPVVALAALPLTVVTDEDGPAELAGSAESSDAAPIAPVSRPKTTTAPRRSRPESAPTHGTETASNKSKKGRKKCLPGNEAIERLDGGTYSVERSLIEGYAKKPATLGSLGWAAVHDGENGKHDGFRVGGIRCGNDLHAAGLRNGDVVRSVNGRPVRSIPEALWAYAHERKADRIELAITRKGQERVLTYRVS